LAAFLLEKAKKAKNTVELVFLTNQAIENSATDSKSLDTQESSILAGHYCKDSSAANLEDFGLILREEKGWERQKLALCQGAARARLAAARGGVLGVRAGRLLP